MDRELFLDLYGDDHPDPDGYCKHCGSIVTVKNYPATWDDWHGGSPPEQTITCPNCGEVGRDDISEAPQERCGVCEDVLTDRGVPCARCEEA